MSYRLNRQDVCIACDTPAEAIALLEAIAGREPRPLPATLADALGKPAKKKPGPKPKTKKAEDEVLTAEEKARLAAEVPLVCRKPRGCGKPFQSENRMAWYCPACTAKRDEGRPV
jgi:hypothetical protein